MPWFLKKYTRTFDIYQTDYNIHSRLRIFPIFWSHSWKYNIQPNERLTKVKEKWSTFQFDLFDLSFVLFIPVFQTISVSGKCACVCACYPMHQMEKTVWRDCQSAWMFWGLGRYFPKFPIRLVNSIIKIRFSSEFIAQTCYSMSVSFFPLGVTFSYPPNWFSSPKIGLLCLLPVSISIGLLKKN